MDDYDVFYSPPSPTYAPSSPMYEPKTPPSEGQEPALRKRKECPAANDPSVKRTRKEGQDEVLIIYNTAESDTVWFRIPLNVIDDYELYALQRMSVCGANTCLDENTEYWIDQLLNIRTGSSGGGDDDDADEDGGFLQKDKAFMESFKKHYKEDFKGKNHTWGKYVIDNEHVQPLNGGRLHVFSLMFIFEEDE